MNWMKSKNSIKTQTAHHWRIKRSCKRSYAKSSDGNVNLKSKKRSTHFVSSKWTLQRDTKNQQTGWVKEKRSCYKDWKRTQKKVNGSCKITCNSKEWRSIKVNLRIPTIAIADRLTTQKANGRWGCWTRKRYLGKKRQNKKKLKVCLTWRS